MAKRLYPDRESNSDLLFRRELFYPLNYQGNLLWCAKIQQLERKAKKKGVYFLSRQRKRGIEAVCVSGRRRGNGQRIGSGRRDSRRPDGPQPDRLLPRGAPAHGRILRAAELLNVANNVYKHPREKAFVLKTKSPGRKNGQNERANPSC